MKRLVAVPVQKETDDGVVTQHLIQIQGEEEEYSAKKVDFKVYDIQTKLIARDPVDPFIVTNESVFFGDFPSKEEGIPDRKGTNACGRTFPSWEGTEFSPAQRQAQAKIAGWYGYLFGEVTFPGKKPMLVNMRLTGPKIADFNNKFRDTFKRRGQSTWPSYLLEIAAKGQAGKPQFVDLTFNIAATNLDTSESEAVANQVQDYITEHNKEILTSQQNQ